MNNQKKRVKFIQRRYTPQGLELLERRQSWQGFTRNFFEVLRDSRGYWSEISWDRLEAPRDSGSMLHRTMVRGDREQRLNCSCDNFDAFRGRGSRIQKKVVSSFIKQGLKFHGVVSWLHKYGSDLRRTLIRGFTRLVSGLTDQWSGSSRESSSRPHGRMLVGLTGK